MRAVLTFAGGVAASTVAWMLVTVALRPKLRWSEILTRRDFGDGRRPSTGYRCTWWNARWFRAALDVRAHARMRVKGLAGRGWAIFEIPVNMVAVPKAPPARRHRGHFVVQLELDRIPSYALGWFPAELANKCQEGEAELEQLFALGEERDLTFVATCRDAWSGTFGVFASIPYSSISETRAGRPQGR